MSGNGDATVDCEAVWTAVQAEPSFQTEVPSGQPREVFREFVYAIPEVLQDLLTERVSLLTLFKVKMAVIKLFLDGGWAAKLLRSYPSDMLSGDPDDLIEPMQEALRNSLPAIEGIESDLPSWLRDQGLSEEEALAHPRLGKLSRSMMKLYRQGELTIGGLLELQPMVILKNT